MIEDYSNTPKLYSWWIEKNEIDSITNKRYPWSFLNKSRSQAFLYNPMEYNPEIKIEGDVDFMLYNIESSRIIDSIKKVEYKSSRFHIGPNDQYVFYFKDSSWISRNIKNGEEINISSFFKYPLYDFNYSRPGNPPAYGIPGYIAKAQTVLIYDQYDIWSFDLKTKKKKRITNGRENGITYRIVPNQGILNIEENSKILNEYDLEKPLFL